MPKVQQAAKAPVNFGSAIIISDLANLSGNHTINISSDTAIHPRSKIESSNGRITIGRKCVVHERTHIGAASSTPGPSDFGVMIEDYVTVEVGAVIESGNTTISRGCMVGVGTKVGKGAKLGEHCTITAKSFIQPGEEVPPYTVVYSNGKRRTDKRDVIDLKQKAQTRQIEVLRKLIASNPSKFKD